MSASVASPRLPAGLAFLLAAATIAGAWGFQLIGGYVPCALCLSQRVPYYAGLPLVAVGLLVLGMPGRGALARVLFLVAAAGFLYGAGLGAYQAGAEWGFWPGPTDCGGGVATTSNAGDLLAQLKATRVVSCTEASWRLLGLSFAGWNAVVSALAAALLAVAALAPARAAGRG